MNGLQGVALDTSILCRPFDRRFLMAAWEVMGARAPVLPRVAKELFGKIADNEVEHWSRRVFPHEEQRGWTYSDADKHHMLSAVENGAQAWVRNEIDAQNSPRGGASSQSALCAVHMSAAQLGAAAMLGVAIPEDCFRGPSDNHHHGDRMVIGEATIMGYAVLASRNRRSIIREPMNAWLRERAGLNADLVRDADETVLALFRRMDPAPNDVALRSVLLACLPEAPVAPRRETEIVRRFIEVLANSSFPDCAEGALNAWNGPNALTLVQETRQALPGSKARATEAGSVSV